jgi:hypothetical protein
MVPATIALMLIALPAPGGRSYECLVPPPPCEALQQASIVLVADLLESDSADDELLPGSNLPPQSVRLKVIERFKGVTKEQVELKARIWFDSNSVLLKDGKRFLVYATSLKGYQDVWLTGCTRTKPLNESNRAELQQLRKCVQP